MGSWNHPRSGKINESNVFLQSIGCGADISRIGTSICPATISAVVRHDRALARACNDPGKTRRVDHFRKQLSKLLRAGFLEMSQDGRLDSP
jgi:hypothetical protein